MVQPRGRAVKIPCFHRDVELLDLLPAFSRRRHRAEPLRVTEIVERRGVQRRETQLVEFVERRSLHGDSEADERIVDNVPPVPLSEVLPGAADGQVPHVWERVKRMDEAGHVCGGVEERRILLRQDVAQLRVGILAASERGAHARMGRVQEAYLLPGERMHEGREEGRLGVRHLERQVLDVVADAVESRHAGGFSEGGGREGDGDAGEEVSRDEVAACRREPADGGNVRGGEVRE